MSEPTTKTLTLAAPDVVFDLAVAALHFNGGYQEGDALEHAKTRLRKWLRDEIAAYQLAHKHGELQVELETYKAGLDAQLDAAAELLELTVE